MRELILEIGTEEMPAGFVPQALESLRGGFGRWMEEERVEGKVVKVVGTPRRLALLAELSETQSALEMVKLGPPKRVAFDEEGNPTKAAHGFARQQGVSVQELIVVETERGEYVGIRERREGRPTRELLRDFLPQLITSIPLPKAMRWADRRLRFIRPIHWIVAVFGGEVVDFELDGISSGDITRGHRFMAPEGFRVSTIEGYLKGLKEAFVIADPDERRERIKGEVGEKARAVGGRILEEGGLLEEVTHLVEWPVAVLGKFDDEFLDLPQEVLVTAMEHHQRYFPVANDEGKLLPFFVAVANTQAKDMEVVRRGNERVLKARLADAKFFYEEDLKIPLEKRVEELKEVVYQAKLGTLYEKTLRVGELSVRIASKVCPHKVEVVRRAAYLAKADLLTEMVGEFPQLQGIMGREYALKGGESPEVAEAIFEHYLPRYAGDRLPRTDPGAVLSIADKIDSVVGCFGIGLLPTGTSDPFALRRQTLGVIHTILDRAYHLSLREMVEWALELLAEKVERPEDEVKGEVLEFFKGRYEGLLTSEGWPRDEVEAVLEVQKDDLVDAKRRIEALHAFRQDEGFSSVVIAFKRVANIVRGRDYPPKVRPELFREGQEQRLFEAYRDAEDDIRNLIARGRYLEVLKILSDLRPAIDDFFDHVLVMAEEEVIRENRLALLGRLYELFREVADLSKIAVKN